MDDVLFNKAQIIERCMARVQEEYAGNPSNLTQNFTKQDAIILNLQRACETSIDMAMHVVRLRTLGIPQESRDAFLMLFQAGIIDQTLSERMAAMVGFRNVAVHDYRKLNLEIVRSIIEQRLGDFLKFSKMLMKEDGPPAGPVTGVQGAV